MLSRQNLRTSHATGPAIGFAGRAASSAARRVVAAVVLVAGVVGCGEAFGQAAADAEVDAELDAGLLLATQIEAYDGPAGPMPGVPPLGPEEVAPADDLDAGGDANGDPPRRPTPGGDEQSAGKPPRLQSIRETSIDTAPTFITVDGEQQGSGELPVDVAARQFGSLYGTPAGGNEVMRFAGVEYLWHSPAMRHKPLYFEQPNLERYGTHLGGDCAASAIATARFVAAAVSLPYQIGSRPPGECRYTLGVYRPGNCNPHHCHASPISGKGLLYQGAAVSGLVFLFP
ncbi:MAG: hypothetical protein AAF790_12565 [Planctomycetota bacterium]